MGLHALNSLEYVQEFLLFCIEKAGWVRLISFGILIVHDILTALLVTLQQIQALIRHLVIDTVDLTSTRLLKVLKLDP